MRLILFLNIYGWFEFYTQSVHRSKMFCFYVFIFYVLLVFLSKSVHISNYDWYGVLFFLNSCTGISLCSTKFYFKIPNIFLGYAKKPLWRCIATNTLLKKKG